MDSALGLLGAPPHDKDEFIGHVKWITDYAKRTPAPKYPKSLPLDRAKAEAGEAIYDQHCGTCHAEGGDKVGRSIPLAEIGTSRDRFDTWSKSSPVWPTRSSKTWALSAADWSMKTIKNN